MASPFLSREEVATQLGVSASTVKRLADSNKITHIRVGRKYHFRREWVDDYLESATRYAGLRKPDSSVSIPASKAAVVEVPPDILRDLERARRKK